VTIKESIVTVASPTLASLGALSCHMSLLHAVSSNNFAYVHILLYDKIVYYTMVLMEQRALKNVNNSLNN
jgi:hypothetical protein